MIDDTLPRKMSESYANFALFILGLSILLPSSNTLGGQRLWLIVLFVIMFMGLFVAVSNRYVGFMPLTLAKPIRTIIALLYTYFVIILLSLLLNSSHVSFRDFGEFLRLIIYAEILLIGYFFGGSLSNSEIAKWMLVFLCIQLTLGVLQYTNVFGARDVLSLIWSDRKALLGKRSTGSFGNPNLLGAILLFLYCAISFLSSKKSHRVLGLTLTTIGVFFTGSRTTLLTFIVIVGLVFLVKKQLKLSSFVKAGLVFGLMVMLVSGVLARYGDKMPYMSEITIVFKHGVQNIQNIRTFQSRIRDWNYKMSVFGSEPDYVRFFGAGPRKEGPFEYLDSQYLFVFIRYGLLGVLLYLYMWGYIMFVIVKNKSVQLGLSNLLLSYFLALLIFGIAAETLSSWRLMPPFYWTLGVLIGRWSCSSSDKQLDVR